MKPEWGLRTQKTRPAVLTKNLSCKNIEEPKHVTSIVSLWDLEHTCVLTKKAVWISLNDCNKMQHNLYHRSQSVTPLSLFWGEVEFFECGSFWLQLSLETHLSFCFCKSNYIELYRLWVPCHKTLNCLHGILQRTQQQGHLFQNNPADKQTTRYERNRKLSVNNCKVQRNWCCLKQRILWCWSMIDRLLLSSIHFIQPPYNQFAVTTSQLLRPALSISWQFHLARAFNSKSQITQPQNSGAHNT